MTWRSLLATSAQFHICLAVELLTQILSITSPEPSGQDSDRLPSPERERRQALEYEEDDVPGQVAMIVQEANVAFPNIPVPRSSDGEVSQFLFEHTGL